MHQLTPIGKTTLGEDRQRGQPGCVKCQYSVKDSSWLVRVAVVLLAVLLVVHAAGGSVADTGADAVCDCFAASLSLEQLVFQHG